MAPPTRLKAGRLWLRPPEAEDGAAVVAALSDLATRRWLGRVPHPYGAGDFAGHAASAKVLAGLGFREVARDRRPSASLGIALPHVTLRLRRADWAGAKRLDSGTAPRQHGGEGEVP